MQTDAHELWEEIPSYIFFSSILGVKNIVFIVVQDSACKECQSQRGRVSKHSEKVSFSVLPTAAGKWKRGISTEDVSRSYCRCVLKKKDSSNRRRRHDTSIESSDQTGSSTVLLFKNPNLTHLLRLPGHESRLWGRSRKLKPHQKMRALFFPAGLLAVWPLNPWPLCCATKLPSGADLSGHVLIVPRKQEHLAGWETNYFRKTFVKGIFAPYRTSEREHANRRMSKNKMQDPKSRTKRGLQSAGHCGARLDSPWCHSLWHVGQWCFAPRPTTCDCLKWLNSSLQGGEIV